MPSSTSNFDFVRPVPDLPWRAIVLAVTVVTAVAAVAWEIRVRTWGYVPTYTDNSDLWADQRAKVKPDSIVIIGDSRALFDSDLNTLEQGLGQRPVQLAMVGSCAYPILENLANDESFHGTVICSLLPAIWMAPAGSSPTANSEKALKRYRNRTVSQRAGSSHITQDHIRALASAARTGAQRVSPDRFRVSARAGAPSPRASAARRARA